MSSRHSRYSFVDSVLSGTFKFLIVFNFDSHAGGAALDHTDGIAVVNAKRGAARVQAHAAAGLQLLEHMGEPLRLRAADRAVEQGATQFKVLLHEHDLGTGAGRLQSSS